MRTTVTLNDQLLTKLKKHASESGTSVSSVIEQAIRLFLQSPPRAKRKEAFELVTFGRGGHFSKRNMDKTSSLLEDEDLDRFVPRR
jgi:Arc/MetJ-type ribon-helix-helix transcriptional regulator